MTVTVRRTVVADADALGRVHVQAWRETYAHLLSQGLLGFGVGGAPRGAVAFYRRNRFALDGERMVDLLEGEPLAQVRMVR